MNSEVTVKGNATDSQQPRQPLRPRVEMLQTACPETCHYSSHLIVGEKNSLTRLVLFHQVETCLVKTAFSLETIAKAINSQGWASQMLQAIVIESNIGLTQKCKIKQWKIQCTGRLHIGVMYLWEDVHIDVIYLQKSICMRVRSKSSCSYAHSLEGHDSP